MIEFKQQESLTDRNSMRVESKTQILIQFDTEDDCAAVGEYLRNQSSNWIILGGGNNILFKPYFSGIVVFPRLFGIHRIASLTESEDLIEASASEDWDQFVAWSLENDYRGLENLSLIPGTVGASPVQNIGAYGAEAEHFIEYVIGWDFEAGKFQKIMKPECRFAYRESVFKSELKEKFLITRVGFRLSKTGGLNCQYGDVQARMAAYKEPGAKELREVILSIRQSKLPDPAEIPNSGSFFKNPIVPVEKAAELKGKYPEMPVYPAGSGYNKLAAGWLIEKSGWKGKSSGPAAVHDKQALVLVNRGGATGDDLLHLADKIKADVSALFGVSLEMEVNVY